MKNAASQLINKPCPVTFVTYSVLARAEPTNPFRISGIVQVEHGFIHIGKAFEGGPNDNQ
jgi:hypothetical protein